MLNIFNTKKRQESKEKELQLEKTKIRILEGTLKQIISEFEKSKDDTTAKLYYKEFEKQVNDLLNESYSKIQRLEK